MAGQDNALVAFLDHKDAAAERAAEAFPDPKPYHADMARKLRKQTNPLSTLADSYGFQIKRGARGAQVSRVSGAFLEPAIWETMRSGFKKRLGRVITSGTEAHEGLRSMHGIGEALDFRGSWVKNAQEGHQLAAEMQQGMPQGFQIIFETTDREGKMIPKGEWHFHLEHDTPETQAALDRHMGGTEEPAAPEQVAAAAPGPAPPPPPAPAPPATPTQPPFTPEPGMGWAQPPEIAMAKPQGGGLSVPAGKKAEE